MQLLSRAIYYAVLSALVTAALLIGAFVAALVGLGHGGVMAVMFRGGARSPDDFPCARQAGAVEPV